jgi:hypothetical protein
MVFLDRVEEAQQLEETRLNLGYASKKEKNV